MNLKFADETLPEGPFTIYAIADETGNLAHEGCNGAGAYAPAEFFRDGNEAYEFVLPGQRVVRLEVSRVVVEPLIFKPLTK